MSRHKFFVDIISLKVTIGWEFGFIETGDDPRIPVVASITARGLKFHQRRLHGGIQLIEVSSMLGKGFLNLIVELGISFSMGVYGSNRHNVVEDLTDLGRLERCSGGDHRGDKQIEGYEHDATDGVSKMDIDVV
ncbi:hypothetical protein FEM48_Zijuj02G0072300 [Ziziphus jujuba var. spinosa]|uniref:Uncharacterized protein n=1 Tax=Ziziphus jujuba var. spinosa TaxID=714518 RepID=A0A978VUD1_ZIZJJ|nr:hypothetical protein FEM48_Zijuj02G0072300 [Ziziphus jujuba var. spinosa]